MYDDPKSSLSWRLEVVASVSRPSSTLPARSVRVLSICAGDGRDVLPVLARNRTGVSTVLVELAPGLSSAARRAARELGLTSVELRTADAGQVDTHVGVPPVDVLLACGVFGTSLTPMQRSVSARRPAWASRRFVTGGTSCASPPNAKADRCQSALGAAGTRR
jgi:hypothetical protein